MKQFIHEIDGSSHHMSFIFNTKWKHLREKKDWSYLSICQWSTGSFDDFVTVQMKDK